MKLRAKLPTLDGFVVSMLLCLIPFSGWPSWLVRVSEREITVEPAMASVLLCALYMIVRYGADIFRIAASTPWRYLSIWFIFSTGVALLRTDSPIPILLLAVYFIAILSTAMGIFHLLRSQKITVAWFIKNWILVATTASLAAIIQFIIVAFTDSAPILPAYNLGVFSFPRAHGFALEPLFFAQWLLVPLTYLLYRLSSKDKPTPLYVVALSILLLALWLTLARSAFIAMGVSAFVLILFYRRKFSWDNILKTILAPAVATFVLAMVLIGLSTVRNSTSGESFTNGVGRYLDHASLGVFNRTGAENAAPAVLNEETGESTFVGVEEVDTVGVVEASTLGRIEVLRDALRVYRDSPSLVLFGMGKGRLGEELASRNPRKYLPNQATNNQYVEVVVETGLVGVALLGMFIGSVWLHWRKEWPKHGWLIASLCALAAQFMFFSNYVSFPFWIGVALVVGTVSQKRRKGKKT